MTDETDKEPHYATGKEMYARLARPGPPLATTLRGLPERDEPRISVSEALAAKPQPKVQD